MAGGHRGAHVTAPVTCPTFRSLPPTVLNGSYYAVCAADGDCQSTTNPQISGFGGTSVSSPAFAGIMAIVNQAYGPQGQADYELYPLAAKEPSAFHDITAGHQPDALPRQARPIAPTGN